MDRAETEASIRALIEPFNKKGAAIADATTFAGDLEFDSRPAARGSPRCERS